MLIRRSPWRQHQNIPDPPGPTSIKETATPEEPNPNHSNKKRPRCFIRRAFRLRVMTGLVLSRDTSSRSEARSVRSRAPRACGSPRISASPIPGDPNALVRGTSPRSRSRRDQAGSPSGAAVAATDHDAITTTVTTGDSRDDNRDRDPRPRLRERPRSR